MYSADAALKIAHHHFCILYDGTSGKIVSTFESITLEGAGPAPQQRDIESRARTQSSKLVQAASGQPLDTKNLKALFVGPEAFKEFGPKKVDVKQQIVIPARD